MSFIGKFLSAAAALVLSASSALAVTYTITQTAEVSFIEETDAGRATSVVSDRTVNPGDIATLSYVVDLAETGTIAAPGVSLSSWTSSSAQRYSATSVMLSFDTGLSFNLDPMRIELGEATDGVNYYGWAALFPTGPVSGADVFSFGDHPTASTPYSTDLATRLSRSVSIDTILDIYVPPSALGLAADACIDTKCGVGVDVTDFSSERNGTSVAAVPLPAPFVMLGAAMLGLAGLGRRRNA